MAESVSYIHPTGALICVSAVCLAFIVSYLALKSRGRVSRRGVNGAGPTSVPLCKVCHQLVKNTPSQNHLTKEWTCSACSGYSRSTEVSPDAPGDGDDQSDLEIQHTLGSMAIGHTNVPESRASPHSWLHLIEELNLLPEQTSNQKNSPHEVNINEIGDENVADFSTLQPSANTVTTDTDVMSLSAAKDCTRKPLIQPARLKVRRRRFSINSATAALSLAGNGCSFGDHVTNRANSCSVNGEAPNPFLHVPNNSHRCMNIRRNSAVVERQKENYFHQGGTNFHSASQINLVNGNGVSNHRRMNGHMPSQNPHRILSLHTATTAHTTHRQQQSSSLSSPLFHSPDQPQSIETQAASSINSHPPHSDRFRWVVGALVLLSVTGNIVLLLLLFMHVYKPSFASSSSSWVAGFSDL